MNSLRALGHLLVREAAQVVVEVVHGIDALQRFRRQPFGDHVGDEGVEDGHLLAEAHLRDLLEERHRIGRELRGDQNVRLCGADLLQDGGEVAGAERGFVIADDLGAEFLGGRISAVTHVPAPAVGAGQEEDLLLAERLHRRLAGHIADRPRAVGGGEAGIGELALHEGFLRHHADREVGHRVLGDDGVDGIGQRRPGLPADALDAFRNQIAITADADVELGFVVVDDAFDCHLAPGHVETALLVDDVDREQRALFLSFRHRRERAGERQQDAHFDLGGSAALAGLNPNGTAERGNREKTPAHLHFTISSY